MNNPRSVFFLFLAVLLALGVLVSWWLGPGLVGIVWDGEVRRSPYLVLALEPTPSAAAAEQPFGVSAALLPDAVALRWRATTPRVAVGSSAPQRGQIEFWSFVTGGDFVRFATSGEFRQAQRGVDGTRALYGLSAPLLPGADAAVTYPVLFAATRDGSQGIALDLALQPVLPPAATVPWLAQPTKLTGDGNFEEFLLVNFPSAADRQNWLWNDGTQLELELLRTRFNRLQAWELGGLER